MPQPRPFSSPFGVVTRHRPGHPAGSTLRVTLSPKDHFRRGQQATARAAAESAKTTTRTLATRRCKCAHNLKTFAAAATGNCKWQKLALQNFADASRVAPPSLAPPPRHKTKTCRGHREDSEQSGEQRAADALKSL